jgi:hypothetical protein
VDLGLPQGVVAMGELLKLMIVVVELDVVLRILDPFGGDDS